MANDGSGGTDGIMMSMAHLSLGGIGGGMVSPFEGTIAHKNITTIAAPAEHYFIIDVSSSMSGDRIEGVLKGLNGMMFSGKSHVRANDTITVFTFKGHAVRNVMDSQRPGDIDWNKLKRDTKIGDGTNMFDAIVAVMGHIRQVRSNMYARMRDERTVYAYCFTDGEDTSSTSCTINDASDILTNMEPGNGISSFSFFLMTYGMRSSLTKEYKRVLCTRKYIHIIAGGSHAGSTVRDMADMYRGVTTIVTQGRSFVVNQRAGV
ncbi:hypothetical protein JKP88DRAFT_313704 [Tribonema minus]|uniref:VWFA domain-containing protein n=1 Tax=Tribonema minus TaxID=303371 RepID=A0A835Z7W7_9STRA|nr:hypothetical protein JKP88DRAFT_313704 [Tribonema minus]